MKKSLPPNHKGRRVMKHSKKRKKMDVDGAMGTHLQEEIIMDILSRLPVRSLLRFKYVSKFWMTLISEPYFTVKHLNHVKNNLNPPKILALSKEFSFHCSSLSSVQLFEDVQKLEWPSSSIRKPSSCKLYCCYNGLALIGLRELTYYHGFSTERHILLLWNPSTGESIVLPRTKFSPMVKYTLGLGYDSASDDYKILQIDNLSPHSKILALKSGLWRNIDEHPTAVYHRTVSDMDSLAFVHGAFHWLNWSLVNSVVSFSISNEVYGEILLQEGMSLDHNKNNIKYSVSVLEGMLCLYFTNIRFEKHTFKLWVMKEYGVKESWYQLFTIQGTGACLYSFTPIYRFSDGEVLLRCKNWERDSVFKTSKKSSGLWPQSDSERIQDGLVYTESLISPKLLT